MYELADVIVYTLPHLHTTLRLCGKDIKTATDILTPNSSRVCEKWYAVKFLASDCNIEGDIAFQKLPNDWVAKKLRSLHLVVKF